MVCGDQLGCCVSAERARLPRPRRVVRGRIPRKNDELGVGFRASRKRAREEIGPLSKMEKRSFRDVFKLFGVGALVAGALFFTVWVQEDELKISHHWQLFITAHIFVAVVALYNARSMLRKPIACSIIVGWLLLRTVIAYLFAREGADILSVLMPIPVEFFFIFTIAKMANRWRRS